MLLAHGTVIALVDGKQFELFRNTGNEAEPELAAIDAPKLDEHNKGSGGHHHSSSGNPTGHLLDEDAHAAAVADWLNQQVLSHKIEHLVVIAAPRTLGELRRHYHKQLESMLQGELPKDLIGKQGPEIIAALRGK
ncbi:attachment protein [Croceicoccus estronivorus]|uniref:baeRF12 domain-containing protein n=1 Tax=Croceicoccus estronivorus TaxID=1172626 RepID=UPI00082C9819|nr:host attachment protein [Croceicoccus estronivorus]OCC24797.1 attachment protein [Croceicoccus estronivorus]